jgi:hypothetical protein
MDRTRTYRLEIEPAYMRHSTAGALLSTGGHGTRTRSRQSEGRERPRPTVDAPQNRDGLLPIPGMVIYDHTDGTVERSHPDMTLTQAQQAAETDFPSLDDAAAAVPKWQTSRRQPLVRKRLECACGHISRWEVMGEDSEVYVLQCNAQCAANRRQQQLADAFSKCADAPPSFVRWKDVEWPVQLVLVCFA